MLQMIHSEIRTLFFHEGVMVSDFQDAAFIDDDDFIDMSHRGESVGDHQSGSSRHQFGKGILNDIFSQ